MIIIKILISKIVIILEIKLNRIRRYFNQVVFKKRIQWHFLIFKIKLIVDRIVKINNQLVKAVIK